MRVPSPSTLPFLQDLLPLRPAERLVLQAWADGDIAKLSYRRPGAPRADVTLRAAFLAGLARHGASAGEGRRIEILGAWVQGRLNLVDAAVPTSLWFYRCVFDTTPWLDGARIVGSIGLPGCLLPGLRAEAATVEGDVSLGAGCTIRGSVRLARATIGRDLDCARLLLRAADPDPMFKRRPLVADGARIGGNVVLGDGFEAEGQVRLVGARIAGHLRVGRASIGGNLCPSGVRGAAFKLDGVRVAGSVFLDGGLAVAGRVRLQGAHIAGDLDCSGALFDKIGDASWDDAPGLLLDRAHIGGTLRLRGLRAPLRGASFADARVGALDDDVLTWGDRLVLDGFAYARLAPGAPADARFRRAWLMRQVPAHLGGADFRTGPWRRLIRVLRRQGHELSARELAIGREEHLRRIGRVGAAWPRPARALAPAVHRLFGVAAGYGHRPQRLLAGLAVVWLVCGLVFGSAAQDGAFVPRQAPCAPDCAAAAATDFRPFVYSLDLLLPIIDLQQEQGWAPAAARSPDESWHGILNLLAWLEPLLGAAACAALLAAWFGLTDRDRRV